jgi:hypothetical protein
MAVEEVQRANAPAGLKRVSLRTWHWPIIVGLLACLYTQLRPHKLLADGDTQTHIAVGNWIFAHHAIPFRDVFSYTLSGQEWVPHEWGAELILAATYDWLGWGGVIALTELAIFASFVLFTRALLRYFVPRRAAMGAAVALLLALPHLFARPHVLALPLLVLWFAELVAARDDARVPSFKLLPVMVLWANLHAGFMIGLGFAGFLGIEAVIEAKKSERISVARGWGLFTLLAGLASLVSVNGINVYLMTLKLMQMDSAMSGIGEWQPAYFGGYQPVEMWLIALLLVTWSTGLRLSLTRALMLLLLLHVALTHARNMELLGFISPLLIAKPLSEHLQKREDTGAELRIPLTLGSRARFAAAFSVLFAFLAVAGLYNRAGFTPDEAAAPGSALQAARAAHLDGPVLNNYDFGGFLIQSGVPVFIDGRADLYGDQFLRTYLSAREGNPDVLTKVLDRYSIEWTIFNPSAGAVAELDHLPGWTRTYTDKFAVIHRRIR